MTIEQSAGYMPFRPTQELRDRYRKLAADGLIRQDTRHRARKDLDGGKHEYTAHFLEVNDMAFQLVEELTAQYEGTRVFQFGDATGAHLFTQISHPNLLVDNNTYHEDTFMLPPGSLYILEELMDVRLSMRTSKSPIVREMAHAAPAAYWALRQAGHIRPPIQK